MIGVGLYIIVCSLRNRLRVRLRRLREPRYLIGAIVGATYIYFSFFARFRARPQGRRRSGSARAVLPGAVGLATAGPALGSMALLALTSLGWIFPFNSGLLEFSAAETELLFPAPVSRRSLLVYRMLRSQLGMLFGSIVVAVVTPSVAGLSRLRIAIGIWMLLCTWKIYFTGISLARSRLRAGDRHARRVAWMPLLLLGAATAVVGLAVWRVLQAAPVSGPADLVNRLAAVPYQDPARLVLWPFMALVRPLFAPWPWPYLRSLAASIAVLAATATWVLRSDSAFQDAAEESALRSERRKSANAGGYRVRSAGWQLAAVGPPEAIFAWKAALQTVRVVDRASALRIAAALTAFLAASAAMGQQSGWAGAVVAFALAGSAFSIVLAPQALRLDLRQDLQHLEVLKTWPLRSGAIVRGELIWPAVLLTAASWVLTLLALMYSSAMIAQVTLTTRVAVATAVLILAPALIVGQLVIQNAMALLFPAWVPLGNQRQRGLDAMGQRIILLGGTWLLLAIMALPGVIAAGVAFFVLSTAIGAAACVPAAGILSVALLVEAFVATELLAPVYDRLDLLSVERPE